MTSFYLFTQIHSNASDYSLLKLLTGLDNAALIACVLMVIKAMMTAMNAAAMNIHQAKLIRYAKSFNQLFIIYHAIGNATIAAIATNFKKSLTTSVTTLDTLAPSTFLMPISFTR